MKLIIGLGNPGEEYKNNRHNAGYIFVDEAKDSNKKNSNLVFLKTNSFMNSSGDMVVKEVKTRKTKPEDLYIVHDDLDIPIGSYKIQFGIGPKVHNGINDIEEKLGNGEFWRIRVGVDNRNPEDRTKGEDYVLQDFSPEEKEIVDLTIKKTLKELYEKLQ